MKKYNVHFSGYYGYDVEIEAETEREALEKATMIHDEADPNDFDLIPHDREITDMEE